MRRWLIIVPVLLALAGCHKKGPSLDELAAQGQILTTAPVQFSGQITINATPDRVYGLLIDLPDWPNWQRDITNVVVNPPIQTGTTFGWVSGGYGVQSTIDRAVPNQSLAWTGKLVNFHIIQLFNLTPGPNGTTIVTMQESLSGFLVKYFYSSAELAQSDERWFSYLKSAAERPPQN
jgi:hypothetical protein